MKCKKIEKIKIVLCSECKKNHIYVSLERLYDIIQKIKKMKKKNSEKLIVEMLETEWKRMKHLEKNKVI